MPRLRTERVLEAQLQELLASAEDRKRLFRNLRTASKQLSDLTPKLEKDWMLLPDKMIEDIIGVRDGIERILVFYTNPKNLTWKGHLFHLEVRIRELFTFDQTFLKLTLAYADYVRVIERGQAKEARLWSSALKFLDSPEGVAQYDEAIEDIKEGRGITLSAAEFKTRFKFD